MNHDTRLKKETSTSQEPGNDFAVDPARLVTFADPLLAATMHPRQFNCMKDVLELVTELMLQIPEQMMVAECHAFENMFALDMRQFAFLNKCVSVTETISEQ